MVNSKYADAYKEVLIVINKLNKDDFDKIPPKYIEFFEANCNNEYNFVYDNTKSFGEQELLDDTKYILFCLFEKFGATEKQRLMIKSFKTNYFNKQEEQKRQQYNPDDIFKKSSQELEINQEIPQESVAMIEYKESIFRKIVNKIRSFLKI